MAGANVLTITKIVVNVPLELWTFKSNFMKRADFRVVEMSEMDIILGRDVIFNNLQIRSDLIITTEKGEQLRPWTVPLQEQDSHISVRHTKKMVGKPDSSCYVAVVKSCTVDSTDNGGEKKEWEQRFLKEHSDIFSEDLPSFKEGTQQVEHKIELEPGAEPPCAKLRRFSPKEMDEIGKQIQTLLEQNFISPSQSPFGANVLLVKKSNGTWRMCVDYRALNRLTVKDKYPLPNLHDQLQYLQQAKYFSNTFTGRFLIDPRTNKDCDVTSTIDIAIRVTSVSLSRDDSTASKTMCACFRSEPWRCPAFACLKDDRLVSFGNGLDCWPLDPLHLCPGSQGPSPQRPHRPFALRWLKRSPDASFGRFRCPAFLGSDPVLGGTVRSKELRYLTALVIKVVTSSKSRPSNLLVPK